MGKVCSCDSGFSNTGYRCAVNGSVIIASMLMNIYKQDGSLNGIDWAADSVDGVLPDAFMQGKLNDIIKDDRWFHVGNFENVETPRAEDIIQSFNGGNTAKIKDGVKTFAGLLPKKSPKYKGDLDSFRCSDALGVIHIDINGNLIGQSLDGNFIGAIPIDQNTFSPKWVDATDSTVTAINLGYGYSQITDDALLTYISASGTETNMLAIRSLLDVKLTEEVAATVTEVTVKALIDYSSMVDDQIPLKSLIVGDFAVQNITQSTPVVFTLDTADVSKGIYKLEYVVGVAVTDVLEISATKLKYEISPVNSTVV